LAGEGEVAGFPVDAESGDGVASLIAHVEEIACGIDVEAARIIASCPIERSIEKALTEPELMP
jgi:hypothetical protein